jgi:hypothetical protein
MDRDTALLTSIGSSICGAAAVLGAEPVEDDACTEYLLGTELDAGYPCFREVVSQAVGVQHAQDDAYDQGAEGEVLDGWKISDIKCGKGEQDDEEYPVQGIADLLVEHGWYRFVRLFVCGMRRL